MQYNFEKEISSLGEKQKFSELEELIKRTSTKDIVAVLTHKIGRSDAACFWNYLLRGFVDNDESKEKRFICVKAFLRQLSSIEVSYKQTYDLLTRLFLDLPSFTNDQLIEIIEFGIDWLKIGDPKCVGWKDLIPETLNILSAQITLNVNSTKTTGQEYRGTIIKSLYTMKWPTSVYTPIANMFREMKLTNDEIIAILKKFCCNLLKLNPTELPALSFQLFSLCSNASQIILPIIALEKYFYKHYYKKLFADMESDSTDFDSIDTHSDKELREAEETVLHHLSYCTQFKIAEQQFAIVLRNLLSCPTTILTPFFLSSTLSMTKINREPDGAPLMSSALLQLLRNVIKNNEDDKEMCKNSAWFRDTLQTKEVDVEKIFTILIDQNKDGKDVITPGLVNLAFILLKTKNSTKLNTIAIGFLQKFIKKRFIFGQGIIKNLAEWMIVEQDAPQYSECLTVLSLTDTYTMSECIKTLKYVLDFFLWIPGNNAMRMMTFILPIMKISHTVRDSFINIMKKAIYSRDLQTCRMGVHGFCMLLKQLRNNNSQRSAINEYGILTQQSISGYSLMSQATFGNKNNPQRHFDMLALEIIGVLRIVFTKPLVIKQTLYEDLTRAIEVNPKLIPHVLQFIERHFQSYFNINNPDNNDGDDDNDDGANQNVECEIKFEKIIRVNTRNDNQGNEIEILEDLGRLTVFVADCVVICEKHEQSLNYNPYVLKNLFKILINDMIQKKFAKSFDIVSIDEFENEKLKKENEPLTHEKNQIALQILGFIESLMYYSLWTLTPRNNNCESILSLFKLHRDIRENIKALSGTVNKKQIKKSKPTDVSPSKTPHNHNDVSINGIVVKKFNFKSENIWELPTLERFQRLLHDNYVPFASSESSSQLRCNREFVSYVLEVTISYIEMLRSQPDYKQIAHSKRILQNLIELTKSLYERCIKRLEELWSNFDVRTAYLCVECFHQSLLTANTLFKRKFTEYLHKIDHRLPNVESKEITTVLQDTIELAIRDEDELIEDSDGKKITFTIIQCLEIIYDNQSFDDQMALESYKWLMKFCQSHEIRNKELGLVHKLLFDQRHKTHSGIFYYSIAMHLEKVFGQIDEELEIKPNFELKSITEATAETCTTYLFNIIRLQIEEIEVFIGKCKSTYFKIKITSQNDQDSYIEILKSMERSITSKLIHICETLLHMTNVSLPLGVNMDNLIRSLMQFYISLTNLTKHFIVRQATIPISFQGIKFDQLIKISGKPLAKRIYSLITYIEANIFETNSKRKKSDPQADKAKVLKDTKLIPKLILRIETFNRFIILLSQKSKTANFTHLLHMGTVRDFRIKTSNLKEAIEKTLTNSDQIENDFETQVEEIEQLLDDENNDNLCTNQSENNDVVNNDIDDVQKTQLENLEQGDKQRKAIKNIENKKNKKKSATNKAEVRKPNDGKKSQMQTKTIENYDIDLSEQSNNDDNSPLDGTIETEGDVRNSESQVMRNLNKINEKTRKRKSVVKVSQDMEKEKTKEPELKKRCSNRKKS